MAKKSFFNRIFGTRPEKKEKENEEIPLEQEEKQKPEPEPQMLDPTLLNLPSDHALYKLWRLRKEHADWLPVPILRLANPFSEEEDIVPEDQLEQELDRLGMLVTLTSESRLAEIGFQEEEEGIPGETAGVPIFPEEPEAPETLLSLEEADSGEEEARDILKIEPEKKPEPDLDAQVLVFLTKDELSAWVLVYPPSGNGREVDGAMLVWALREEGVTYGIHNELMDTLPKSDERYFHLFLAARGKGVVHGKDGEVEDMFPRERKQELKVGEFEKVNYAELNLFHNVKVGDVICKISAPVPGKPGRSVLDTEIPAREGKRMVAPQGRNTALSEDGVRLVATKEGHVEFLGQAFHVKPVLEIAGNVDYSTGNINFLGDVHIHGDACSGFTIRAMGNVTIDGVVEACTIEAGGDLVVVKGVKGDNQAVIQVHHNIFAKYLENAFVCVKENLQTDSIINSTIFCDGIIEVCSGRGIIIGGKVWASSEVRANIVGNRSRHPTGIRLGGRPSQDFEYAKLEQKVSWEEEEIERLDRQPDSAAKMKNLPALRMQLAVDQNKLKQLEKQLKEKREAEEARDEDKKVLDEQQDNRRLVCGIAFPETEITIGDASLRLERDVWQCTAMLVKGEVSLLQIQ